jgi:hypothetical protein
MQDGITTGATVGGITVVYNSGHGSSDNHTLHAWTSKYITIDADGNPDTSETKSGFLDLSGTSHSGESAMGAALSYIEESGGSTTGGGMTWEGTITLRSIYGAALIQSGYDITCGDVRQATITNVSVDVDADTVTLSLGGTGYEGRFSPVAGLGPNSATPYQPQTLLPFQSKNEARR